MIMSVSLYHHPHPHDEALLGYTVQTVRELKRLTFPRDEPTNFRDLLEITQNKR